MLSTRRKTGRGCSSSSSTRACSCAAAPPRPAPHIIQAATSRHPTQAAPHATQVRGPGSSALSPASEQLANVQVI